MVRVKLAKPTQVGGRIRHAGDVVDVPDARVAHFDANGYVAEYLDDVDLVNGANTVHVRHEDPDPDGRLEAHFETQAEAIEFAKQLMLEEGYGVTEPDDEHINVYVSDVVDPIVRFPRDLHSYGDVVRAVEDAFKESDPGMRTVTVPIWVSDELVHTFIATLPSDENGATRSAGPKPSDLDHLGLDGETLEILRDKGGYHYVADLEGLDESHFQKFDGIGPARSKAIVAAVKAYGS